MLVSKAHTSSLLRCLSRDLFGRSIRFSRFAAPPDLRVRWPVWVRREEVIYAPLPAPATPGGRLHKAHTNREDGPSHHVHPCSGTPTYRRGGSAGSCFRSPSLAWNEQRGARPRGRGVALSHTRMERSLWRYELFRCKGLAAMPFRLRDGRGRQSPCRQARVVQNLEWSS